MDMRRQESHYHREWDACVAAFATKADATESSMQAWLDETFDTCDLNIMAAGLEQAIDRDARIRELEAEKADLRAMLKKAVDAIDAALADRDAAWERAIRGAFRATPAMRHEDMAIAATRQRLEAESNRPKDWSEVRQRLRDAGADRWDEQRSWREDES